MAKTLLKFLRTRLGLNKPALALSSEYLAGKSGGESQAFQAGMELTTEGLLLLDEQGLILSYNSSAQAMMHSALSELAGVDFWDVLPERVADQHRSVAEQTMQSAGEHRFVAHFAFEDQWVAIVLRRHADGMVVNLSDASDTHKALQRLRDSELGNQALFDGNPQAMWLFDPESRLILAANEAAGTLYGTNPLSLVSCPVESLFPEGEGAEMMDSLSESGFQQTMRLCTQKRINGEPVLVELACSSVRWKDASAVLVNVLDVGARQLADEKLRQINLRLHENLKQCMGDLQRGRREMASFAYAVSHDLTAPLHVVSGYTKTLTERYASVLDSQGLHYLERIAANTHPLAKLIEDLRTLTALPAMTVTPEALDLAPVCRRLIDELQKRDPNRQVTLEIDEHLLVAGDEQMLVTALACLIDNAWKFTKKAEEGWIKVGMLPGQTPGDSVLFVSDNGAGFDADYADKMFTAFQRLHSSADFPGNGLGLAIVKRVADRHGGTVWATTAPKAGASFFMSLPQGVPLPLPVAD
jgi:PAS domain S-box-containing protein